MSQLSTTSFVQINYNAQACYDRIIPEVGFQISLKHGVHEKIVKLVSQVMKETKYYIKIGQTVTNQLYTNTSNNKVWDRTRQRLFTTYMDITF
jgi:hypothetical protein